MATYAAALAYRGLFGLFPFVLILVVLAGALVSYDSFDRIIEQGKEQIQPLQRMINQAEKRAGSDLLFFGVALAL